MGVVLHSSSIRWKVPEMAKELSWTVTGRVGLTSLRLCAPKDEEIDCICGISRKSWLQDSAAGPTDSDSARLTPPMTNRTRCDDDRNASADNQRDRDRHTDEESNTELQKETEHLVSARLGVND